MKLVSMVDYVLESKNKPYDDNSIQKLHYHFNYAKFLSMPLKLGMFVPCGEDGNILEPPKHWEKFYNETSHFIDKDCLKFQRALKNVLFQGFELMKDRQGNIIERITLIHKNDKKRAIEIWTKGCKYKTIENIVVFSPNITQSAITKYQI